MEETHRLAHSLRSTVGFPQSAFHSRSPLLTHGPCVGYSGFVAAATAGDSPSLRCRFPRNFVGVAHVIPSALFQPPHGVGVAATAGNVSFSVKHGEVRGQ